MRGSFFLRSKSLAWFSLGLSTLVFSVTSGKADDDFARYVWQKTQSQLQAGQVAATGQRVSGLIHADYVRYDKDRNVIGRDSMDGEVFGKDGVLDSLIVNRGAESILRDRTFSCPDLAMPHYRASLFPNDTGGSTLSLNIDIDTASTPGSIGIVNVNRITYLPESFYLSLPVDDDTRRKSQIIQVTALGGGLYPTSMIEIVVEKGVLSQEYYQLTVRIEQLRITN